MKNNSTLFLYIRTKDICKYAHMPDYTLRRMLKKNGIWDMEKCTWETFWALVEFLEEKGLRPNKD